jgi:hypothetical protein
MWNIYIRINEAIRVTLANYHGSEMQGASMSNQSLSTRLHHEYYSNLVATKTRALKIES